MQNRSRTPFFGARTIQIYLFAFIFKTRFHFIHKLLKITQLNSNFPQKNHYLFQKKYKEFQKNTGRFFWSKSRKSSLKNRQS